MLAQKAVDQCKAGFIGERRTAMARTVKHFERYGKSGLFIGTLKFVRLIDWHLRIPVAVEQQEGRVVRVDVKNGTGQTSECGFRVRLSAK